MTIPYSAAESTEVFYGCKNVIDTVLGFTSKADTRIDACLDHRRPLLANEIEEVKFFHCHISYTREEYRSLI